MIPCSRMRYLSKGQERKRVGQDRLEGKDEREGFKQGVYQARIFREC